MSDVILISVPDFRKCEFADIHVSMIHKKLNNLPQSFTINRANGDVSKWS